MTTTRLCVFKGHNRAPGSRWETYLLSEVYEKPAIGWYVAALARRTGKTQWSFAPAWEGTVTILATGANEIVVYSPQVEKLMGLSPKTGKVLWSTTHTDFWP